MFYLGDFAFDRLVSGVAEAHGDIQYILNQLQNAVIEITAEAKEIRDKDGTLIRKTYTSKNGTLSAPNAMLNINIMNAASGTPIETATAESPIDMPKIVYVAAGQTVTLEDYVEGTVKVKAVYNNGASGASFKQAATASDTEFGLTEEGVLTPPVFPAEAENAPTKFLVKYYRKNNTGAVIRNKADKFPGGVELTLKGLYVDPCFKEGVKAAYIYIPSFQVSPEISIDTTTDSTLDYKGDLQVDFCSDNKDLYIIYFPDDTEEDE